MAGGRQINADVIDLREYKKNNQVRDVKNLVIQPFVAEANKIYLLGALPKGAAVTTIYKFNDDNTIEKIETTETTNIQIGDINDINNNNNSKLKNNEIYPKGGDLWITNEKKTTSGYIISYMNTDITDGAYAG